MGLRLQRNEGFVLAGHSCDGARQDGHDLDGAGCALDVDGRLRGWHKFLQRDQVGLGDEAAEWAGVLLQGGAFSGSSGELRLTTAHTLRQIFVLFLLSHAH